MGEKGKDVYYNPETGQLEKCWTKCEPRSPNNNVRACRYYCPDYVHSTTAFSTISTGNENITPSIKHEPSVLTIVVPVVITAILVLLIISACLAYRKIVSFIKHSWLYDKLKPPKSGIQPSAEETVQNRPAGTCEINMNDRTARHMPVQPGQAAIQDPEVNAPLLPRNGRETDNGLDVQDGNIPGPPSVDLNNDHVSTDLKLPDGNESPNDEAMAMEYQLEQDGTAADKIRREEDEVIRGKKDIRSKFGRTKPLPSLPTVSDNEQLHNDETAVVHGTCSSPTHNGEPKVDLEAKKPEWNLNALNQNTAIIPQSTYSTPHNNTSVTHSSYPTRNLIYSALDEQRRRVSTPPSDTSDSVAQDHQDDFKQTENALNGQVTFQNSTSVV